MAAVSFFSVEDGFHPFFFGGLKGMRVFSNGLLLVVGNVDAFCWTPCISAFLLVVFEWEMQFLTESKDLFC